MSIDHILFAVHDFRDAADRFRSAFGLTAIEGGRHAGWGTANWIVPLGESYIEMVGVVDPDLAAKTPFGRRAQEALAAGGGLYAWSVVPSDFEGTVARLGLVTESGSRRRPDGSLLAWRTAGLEVGMSDPSRPFFLAWDIPPYLHPGRMPTPGHERPGRLGWVEVSGDESSVRAWLADPGMPVRVVPGSPALLGVGVATDDGVIEIRRI
jgi:hypothetical protein